MIDIFEWISENKNLIEGVTIEIKDKRKDYDFQQLWYDLVLASMIGLTVKAIIALSVGQTYINLY